MGIRFVCPNGHRLNVKTEFAGKRAVCPECQAKVVVPAASSDVSSESVAAAGQPETPRPQSAETPQPAAPEPPSPPAALPSSPTAPVDQAVETTPAADPVEPQWHVRSATGDRYGPADGETMKKWIEEGRVAAESWVWRTGWGDWQPGSVALETFAQEPSVTPAAALAASDQAARGSAERPLSAAEQRRRTLARRRRRTVQVTVGLIILTAILAVVLAVVLLS